jgi:hypothetical protein
MQIHEVVSVKPKTAEQQRVASLQRSVDNARLALARERERQRQQRATKQIQRLQQPKPAKTA